MPRRSPHAGGTTGTVSQAAGLYQLLVESVRDYAIFALDPNGVILSWNAGARADQGLHGRGDRSASTSRSSTPRRTWPPDKPGTELRVAERATGASRTKGGACGRTARGSGRASSSPRCATPTGGSSASPRSRATSPSGAAPRSAARERGALPRPRPEREGLRHLHARPRRARRELERGRAPHQGLRGRGDPRPALLRLLSAEEARDRPIPRVRARGRARATGGSRTRGGACERTARGSGRTSSSPRSSATTGTLIGFAKVTRDLTERRLAQQREIEDARRTRRGPRRRTAPRPGSSPRCPTSCARR